MLPWRDLHWCFMKLPGIQVSCIRVHPLIQRCLNDLFCLQKHFKKQIKVSIFSPFWIMSLGSYIIKNLAFPLLLITKVPLDGPLFVWGWKLLLLPGALSFWEHRTVWWSQYLMGSKTKVVKSVKSPEFCNPVFYLLYCYLK